MSAHDSLMAELIRLRGILEDYVAEFDPINGGTALLNLNALVLLVNQFPNQEEA